MTDGVLVCLLQKPYQVAAEDEEQIARWATLFSTYGAEFRHLRERWVRHPSALLSTEWTPLGWHRLAILQPTHPFLRSPTDAT